MPCSYCNISGHYINSCPCPTIEIDYIIFRTEYQNVMSIMVLTNEEKERRFRERLNRYRLIQLKAVVLKYTSSTGSLNKGQLIHILWTHFTYSLERTFGQRIPDIIPPFAQDLDANFVEPETNTLEWFEDRTPQPEPDHEYLTSLLDLGTRIQILAQRNQPRSIIVRNLLSAIRQYAIQCELGPINAKPKIVVNEKADEKDEEEIGCPICYEQVLNENEVKLNCDHIFCCNCIKTSLKKYNTQNCALCRTPTTCYNVKNNEVYDVLNN